jgi:hypothetical protein
MSGYVPPPIASQASITSTVPMTSANTSLKYSDRSRHLSLATGNLTTSLQPAYWTFVQSPADRVLPCSESHADPLRGRTLTITRCSAADSVRMSVQPRVVQYPHGRYVLQGDGITTAYQWVWIPNLPSPPPTATPPPPSQ